MDKKKISELVDMLCIMCRKYNVAWADSDYEIMSINESMIDGFCLSLDVLGIDYHFNRNFIERGAFVEYGRFVSFSVDGVSYDVD